MAKILTLHDPRTARSYYESGSWQNDTLYGLLVKHATERASAYALRDGRRRLTWREWLEAVDCVAADLHRQGLCAGDRVSIWLPNQIEAAIVLLACARNGYVCNPSLHQNYTVAEILSLLENIRSRALFTQSGYGADGGQADVFVRAREIPAMRCIYSVSSARSDSVPQGALPFPTGKAQDPPPPPETDPDKITYLAFTSGTTGVPKGVMHSDNTLLANARAMVEDWKHDSTTTLLSLSPLSHHIATVGLMQTLVAGCEFVISQLSPATPAIDWIERSEATYVMGVPTHAIDVLAAAKQRSLTRLYRVSVFYMAGAPIPTEVARQLMDLGATPQNIYGMTENGSHHYTLPTDDLETITATCGRGCRSYEIRLWSQDNRDVEVGAGEVGEIGGRGATLMLGYYADQLMTEDSFNASGWFMSGDLGQEDDRGNLRVVGRKKDLIIRGGHNIHPARIEELAHRHPEVSRAAAFGVADERLGEKVCLAVIPVTGRSPTPQALLSHLNEVGLSKFDMPEYFVSLPAFPLTASGKVLKRELLAWVQSKKIQPIPVRWTALTEDSANAYRA
jgi:acyl-CoA synthetase